VRVSLIILLKSAHVGSAFDPKPFIANFEAAVDKLITLRKDIQAKSEQMEKSERVAEREYSKKMADLNRRFEVCLDLLPRLDPCITYAGSRHQLQ
jgi:hypothetical protein